MTLHFIPGMGGDRRMWLPYQGWFQDAVFHDWPRPRWPRAGLAGYARQLIAAWSIAGHDRLIGVSMGGLVAAEIQRQLALYGGRHNHQDRAGIGVIQVSSGTQLEHLNPYLRRLSHWSPILPLEAAVHFLPVNSPGPPPLAIAMLRASDPTFLRWSIRAILKWPGIASPPQNLKRVLGSADRLFPLQRQAVEWDLNDVRSFSDVHPLNERKNRKSTPASRRRGRRLLAVNKDEATQKMGCYGGLRVIQDGSHLMVLSHHQQVAAAIQSLLRELDH